MFDRQQRIALFASLSLPLVLSACGSDAEIDAPEAPLCPAPAELCGEDLGIGTETALVIEGTTVDASNDYGSTCGQGAVGSDVAFTWTAPERGAYSFSLRGSRYDSILTLFDGCGGAQLACDDDISGTMLQSELDHVELEACQTITIVVDGFADTSGAFTLSVEQLVAELCDDDIDNDDDGLIDCDDPDCGVDVCLEQGVWPADWAAWEDEVLTLTNERRAAGATCGASAEHGYPTEEVFAPAGPLEADKFLRLSARLHSQNMAETGFFDHINPDGLDPFERMANAGFTGGAPLGENIAAGQSSPEEVVNGWMESPGHCRNMMEPGFGVLGVGYFELNGSEYRTYWTQNFGGSHGAE